METKIIDLSKRKPFKKSSKACLMNKLACGLKLLSKEEKETLLALLEAFLIDKI